MTLGIIGGLGPLSTIEYYRRIVDFCQPKEGIYPHIVIDSIDMTELLGYMSGKQYDKLTAMLLTSVNRLKNAGAEIAFIASNTPHVVFDSLRSISPLPLVSIVEATAGYARSKGYKRLLLTGTGFTMRNTFYPDTISRMGLECIVPDDEDKDAIHNIIFPDLENGKITPEMKSGFISICERIIAERKIDAVILGCTELPLLIQDGELSVPSIDTLQVHADAVCRAILND